MITFLEYYKLLEAPVTLDQKRNAARNSNALQNPGKVSRWDPTSVDTGHVSDPIIDPNYKPSPVSRPESGTDAGITSDPLATRLQKLLASGLEGEELKAGLDSLYQDVNQQLGTVSRSNRDIEDASRKDPMGAVGAPAYDTYDKLKRSRTNVVKAKMDRNLQDSTKVRELEDGHLILIN